MSKIDAFWGASPCHIALGKIDSVAKLLAGFRKTEETRLRQQRGDEVQAA